MNTKNMPKKLNYITDAIIVSIGEEKQDGCQAIGGEKKLLKLGFKYEVRIHDQDVTIACQTLEMAQFIQSALNSAMAQEES